MGPDERMFLHGLGRSEVCASHWEHGSLASIQKAAGYHATGPCHQQRFSWFGRLGPGRLWQHHGPISTDLRLRWGLGSWCWWEDLVAWHSLAQCKFHCQRRLWPSNLSECFLRRWCLLCVRSMQISSIHVWPAAQNQKVLSVPNVIGQWSLPVWHLVIPMLQPKPGRTKGGHQSEVIYLAPMTPLLWSPGMIKGHHMQQIHQEYVTFDKEQAYPCYVVQYSVWTSTVEIWTLKECFSPACGKRQKGHISWRTSGCFILSTVRCSWVRINTLKLLVNHRPISSHHTRPMLTFGSQGKPLPGRS